MLSVVQSASTRKLLEDAFLSSFHLASDIEHHLSGALRETLERPGSMIRADLALRTGRTYGLPEGSAEKLAIAIEYFHTASLVFDDLPCMDNASHRRGAPCVHHLFGEGAAILAALALINRAYALLWKAVAGFPVGLQSACLDYVEQNLGVAGLLNGQSQDINYSKLTADSRVPQQIALGKTVSLIRLALVLPAMLGGAPPKEIHLLKRLAVSWGLSYQIVDDLKDILHTAEQGGKTTARDADLDRPNLALTIGIHESFRKVDRLMRISDRIISKLSQRQPSFGFLNGIREQFDKELSTLS
ncbi:polyprenyl synthetase family protein [Acidipila rosea]|uniref:Geranylgeranyl diphosphate synthase type II n=1 Tax=Acidipila rosea TaxID=768535 RepID=A0A4R1L623_9BACT|nr:polyprenyl synthetase family protein [Acidipila rosea]MBW4026724.1 hypothetical protein [Acidobacteriota bacterium]MBW4044901.1 hypothetical protein [Acidobacteriota bacterium]TCK73606.1 geranylgeranyl diphosphate synthase type II [Acidipila rosea]